MPVQIRFVKGGRQFKITYRIDIYVFFHEIRPLSNMQGGHWLSALPRGYLIRLSRLGIEGLNSNSWTSWPFESLSGLLSHIKLKGISDEYAPGRDWRFLKFHRWFFVIYSIFNSLSLSPSFLLERECLSEIGLHLPIGFQVEHISRDISPGDDLFDVNLVE
jgi:hypothetical protein